MISYHLKDGSTKRNGNYRAKTRTNLRTDIVKTFFHLFFIFFFKQKTAYEIMPSLVGSEMCIRDSPRTRTAAKEPGKALPPLPGLGHDKLPLERWLNKKKRQLQGKNSDKSKD